MVATDLARLVSKLSAEQMAALDSKASAWAAEHSTPLDFVYRGSSPMLAMTSPDRMIHAGRLMPNPD
jgi:hypothetical protein